MAIDWAMWRRRRRRFDEEKDGKWWEETVGSHTGGRLDFTYPCTSLYSDGHAQPLTQPPSVDERIEDRREAAAWAHAVLDDPRMLILEVSTVGTFDGLTSPNHRAALCEIAVRTADGDLLMDTLVNPIWDPLPTKELATAGLNPRLVEDAPTFRKLRQEFQDLLAGRRVVSFGRSHVYSVLYCELEYHVWGDCLENSVLTIDHFGILDILGRSTFECAQLAYSRYRGRWNTDRHRLMLLKHPSRAASAAERSQTVLKVLQEMATQAPGRYLDLCRQAEEAERSGRSHRRVDTQGERRVRLSPARQAVLIRAGSQCENPSCLDSGYTHDVTDKGEPLLQVHHIDEHAQSGRDHPDTMIALCANCHDRVTRGRNHKQLNETFRAAAGAAHQKQAGMLSLTAE
ncbi:HNH endonuclease [Streptosporangium sp. NPDC002721]|uniref:HNH endonuclease n=1 Tax=Streptosporangium sp. NPDC002721 TaxID=3366188 RepID=UPI0036C50FCA